VTDHSKPGLQAKGFAGAPEVKVVAALPRQFGKSVLVAEALRVEAVKSAAMPPAEMRQAPVAPARGTMHLAPDYEVTRGGMRQQVGAHWQTCNSLARMIAQAALRHRTSGSEAPFESPFTHVQVATAGRYQALIEWIEGSALKCASLEAGRGGMGGDDAKDYIDRFHDRRRELAGMRAAIDGHMALRLSKVDPDGRRSITLRKMVDMMVESDDCTLTDVLRVHGWAKKSASLHILRDKLRMALDWMADAKPLDS